MLKGYDETFDREVYEKPSYSMCKAFSLRIESVKLISKSLTCVSDKDDKARQLKLTVHTKI